MYGRKAMTTIQNCVVVITGASSGIGAALARCCSADGAKLVLAARRKVELDSLARSLELSGAQARAIPTDLSVRSEAEQLIRQTIDTFGRIDVLVNNAGAGHFGSVEETSDEVIAKIFAVNTFALWYTTRPALSIMRRQGTGHIINVASMAGKIGFPFNSAYVAAKHACVGFTSALRAELAGTTIQASVVCPGSVDTDWADKTEGGSMRPLFSASGPLAQRRASETGITLPDVEGIVAPERIAEAIRDCMLHPVPEIYTHRGSKEFARLAATNRLEAERRQLPMFLAEREAYEEMKSRPKLAAPSSQ